MLIIKKCLITRTIIQTSLSLINKFNNLKILKFQTDPNSHCNYHEGGLYPSCKKFQRGLCPPCKKHEGDFVHLCKNEQRGFCPEGILSGYPLAGRFKLRVPTIYVFRRNKKINVYTCKSQFYCLKVGFKGVKTICVFS